MDELIIRALSGEASPFEIERLSRWREESPENESYFQATTKVWSLTAPEPIPFQTTPPDVSAILPHVDPTPPTRSGLKSRIRWFGWRGAGLMAASVAALAVGLQLFHPSSSTPLSTFRAPQDETATVTLNDGSFVRLAGGSVLEERQTDGSREVSLTGRAFFAVAHDESRPFWVQTAAGDIRVLGTRFEVASEEGADGAGAVRVVVVEGRVEVSNPFGSVDVPAGSVARIQAGQAPFARAVDDVYALLDWSEGILVYQGTPLAQVAEEVTRHYGRSLEVEAEELTTRRITAWFGGDPFEEVAESLCLVAEAVCTVEEEGVRMDAGMDSGGR